MHLLLFVAQLINDTEISTEVFVLSLSYKIVDNRRLFLSITVYTSITLFKGDKTPRNIIVEHDMTEIMQVDSLRTGIAGDEDTNFAVFLSKVIHHFLLFGISERSVKTLHLFVIQTEFFLQLLF